MQTSIPLEHDPVRHRTSDRVNTRLDRARRRRIADAIAGGPDAIVARLAQLDREWNIDRALMLTFATLGFAFHELEQRDRRWGWLFRVQIAFLGLHATAGWCPPQPILRRLGFRTQQEIDGERTALKRALEGTGPEPSGPGVRDRF
jgi:hypothetical protein